MASKMHSVCVPVVLSIVLCLWATKFSSKKFSTLDFLLHFSSLNRMQCLPFKCTWRQQRDKAVYTLSCRLMNFSPIVCTFGTWTKNVPNVSYGILWQHHILAPKCWQSDGKSLETLYELNRSCTHQGVLQSRKDSQKNATRWAEDASDKCGILLKVSFQDVHCTITRDMNTFYGCSLKSSSKSHCSLS